MSNKNLVQTTTDEKGREIVMVRVDKTVKEMMAEKPASRWDPSYWHPEYDQHFDLLEKSNYAIEPLENLMLEKTDGITYGQVGKRVYDKNGNVQYLQVSNIRLTGVDIHKQYARIAERSHNDPERSRLEKNDILLINGGVGSLGRACMLVEKNIEYNISQDIDRIRLKNKKQGAYVTVFLNSYFGQKQIERFTKGVSGQTKIGFDHVKSIQIPIMDVVVQKNIESEYKKMSAYHDKAMEAKKNNNETEYKKNIETAEKMLKDLVSKTEAVIRGEQKDII